MDEDRVKVVVEGSGANNLVANYFKTSTFIQSTEELRLETDMVGDVKSFYDTIYSATKTSHILSECVLLDYVDFQQYLPIKSMMIPVGKSYTSKTAKHFVEVVIQAIYHFIKGPKSKQ